jgi:hypothetical protein
LNRYRCACACAATCSRPAAGSSFLHPPQFLLIPPDSSSGIEASGGGRRNIGGIEKEESGGVKEEEIQTFPPRLLLTPPDSFRRNRRSHEASWRKHEESGGVRRNGCQFYRCGQDGLSFTSRKDLRIAVDRDRAGRPFTKKQEDPRGGRPQGPFAPSRLQDDRASKMCVDNGIFAGTCTEKREK